MDRESSQANSPLNSDALFAEVYEELRRLARARLRELRPGQTMHTTALVHEAYLRLVKGGDPGWNGRAHFFGAAARAMRLILIDYARRRTRLKRGAGWRAVDLETVPADEDELDVRIEVLGDSIERLERIDARKAEIASLHLLVGMTHAQIAEAFEVSERTIEREWRFARAWLQREIDGRGGEPAS
jgi:RNA polymerase sigma factor (TIGR02999 family)